MINKAENSLKSLAKLIQERFRSEEIFFGLAMIGTVLGEYGSIVPALAVLCLLAFYYFFFSWYMFSTEYHSNTLFSIFSGTIYSLCLLTIAAIIISRHSYNGLFYFIQLVPLGGVYLYLLKKKQWGVYRGNHYIRIYVIVLLNLYILLFK